VKVFDVLDGDIFGHVGGFAHRSADEGLDRAEHRDVAHVVDRVVAHRTGEHGQVLGVEPRCPDDGLVLVDVLHDGIDLLVGVAQPAQRPGHRLVDDEHRAATDELLGLREREVGLDAGGVAIERQGNSPSRRENRRL
jgi:hypothetical protein